MADPGKQAWLIRMSGPLAGTREVLESTVTRVGRDPSSDIVIRGEGSSAVSARHLEIWNEGLEYRLYDMGSTNGTYINNTRASEATLTPGTLISLGPGGPCLRFELGDSPNADLAATAKLPSTLEMSMPGDDPGPPSPSSHSPASINKNHEEILSAAVNKARVARMSGAGDQTGIIMREMLGTVIHKSSKKFKWMIGLLVVVLVAVTSYAAWQIRFLRREKSTIDSRIQIIEAELRTGLLDSNEIDQLIEELNGYQDQALSLQRNILYRLGTRSQEQDFVEAEIKQLLAEFGAEEYSIPPEFLEQVNRFITRYQERDRKLILLALGRASSDLEKMQEILNNENLPPDLAYIPLVESALVSGSASRAGAAGLWQFTLLTAREYGLTVTEETDERLDIEKSTQAAARYMKRLILDFGTGSSVMLALAAYNLGPSRVRNAVREIEDPFKQRSFWYLYRIRALPAETREYVPKIFAAIIISRNPDRFGFG